MNDSTQARIASRGGPRVHIQYQVRDRGSIVEKELPFVVGVIGDYSGNNSSAERKALAERQFVNIDRDNFDDVMGAIAPGLKLRVRNALREGDNEETMVELNFKAMEDFEPGAVVKQVPQLKQLLEVRNQLRELMEVAGRSPKLEGRLEELLQEMEKIKQSPGE